MNGRKKTTSSSLLLFSDVAAPRKEEGESKYTFFQGPWPRLDLITPVRNQPDLTVYTEPMARFRSSSLDTELLRPLKSEDIDNGSALKTKTEYYIRDTFKILLSIASFCRYLPRTVAYEHGTEVAQIVESGKYFQVAALTLLGAKVFLEDIQHRLTLYPIVEFNLATEAEEYCATMAFYMYLRFPSRSERIRNELLLPNKIFRTDWNEAALAIFTDPTQALIKVSSISATTAGFVPPPHLLRDKSALKTVDTKLRLPNPNEPLACAVCGTSSTYQFAYKHCGCVRELNSCLKCALAEWHDKQLCQSSRIGDYYYTSSTPLKNTVLPQVTCKQCQKPWSLFCLVRLQADRIWMYEQAQNQLLLSK